MAMPRKLWEHPYPQETNMAQFMRTVNRKRNMKLQVVLLQQPIKMGICVMDTLTCPLLDINRTSENSMTGALVRIESSFGEMLGTTLTLSTRANVHK